MHLPYFVSSYIFYIVDSYVFFYIFFYDSFFWLTWDCFQVQKYYPLHHCKSVDFHDHPILALENKEALLKNTKIHIKIIQETFIPWSACFSSFPWPEILFVLGNLVCNVPSLPSTLDETSPPRKCPTFMLVLHITRVRGMNRNMPTMANFVIFKNCRNLKFRISVTCSQHTTLYLFPNSSVKCCSDSAAESK